MPFSLKRFESRLAGRSAKSISADSHAAVAALVRWEEEHRPEVLLMRRAVSERDRWSGQVCLPGGKAEPLDVSLQATAVRETHEELGIQLEHCGRFLGPMDSLPAVARGLVLSTSISPFVYEQTRSAEIQLSHEAAHAFWLPLDLAASGELDSHYHYDAGEKTIELPCWRYEEEVIWGLTFKMLQSLLNLVSRSEE